jgi:hypothetical protein
MQKAERLGNRNLFPEGATVEATLAIAAGAGTAGLVFWRALDASPTTTALATLGGAVLVGAGIYAMAHRAAIRRLKSESDESAISLPGGSEPLSIAEVVSYLQTHLGPEVTAYVSGAEHSDVIQGWLRRQTVPDAPSEGRLRAAYRATRSILATYDDETALAWFFGMNERLGDEAPAYVLRHGGHAENYHEVLAAAEEFAEPLR